MEETIKYALQRKYVEGYEAARIDMLKEIDRWVDDYHPARGLMSSDPDCNLDCHSFEAQDTANKIKNLIVRGE